MFCTKCGGEIADGAAFCTSCGAPVGSVQAAPAARSAAVPAGGAAPGLALAPAPAAKRGGAKIGIAVGAIAVMVVLVAGFATGWFGLAGVQPKEAVEVPPEAQPAPTAPAEPEADAPAESEAAAPAPEEQGTEAQPEAGDPVKSAVEAYTWDELSQISAQIAAAGDEAAAIEVAKRYNLCTPEGKLDGTQVKSVTLADGKQTYVQIVGFAHDNKTSGGKAGITFIFGDGISDFHMDQSNSNALGWEGCGMRQLLMEKGPSWLPADLASVIVPVDKFTNNKGQTAELSSVTATSDVLWLFSVSELCGALEWPGASRASLDILAAEGSQYQLFRDVGIAEGGNAVLTKIYAADYPWWGRSPNPEFSDLYQATTAEGDPLNFEQASSLGAVVPGFCI